MKKLSVFILSLFCIALTAQTKYEIVPIDSARTKWVVRVTIVGPDGGLNIQQTAPSDSVKTTDQFLGFIDNRKAALENEVTLLSDGFVKSTGVSYNNAKKGKVSSEMAGNWNLTGAIQDTIYITISPQGKITGGTINGTVEVVDKDNVILRGIIATKIDMERGPGGIWQTKDKAKKLTRIPPPQPIK